MKFLTKGDGEEIISLVSKYEGDGSFRDVEAELAMRFPRICKHIMAAIKAFYMEEREDIPSEIKDAWERYAGKFVRLSELEYMIDEFCKRHNIEREKFRRWLCEKPRIIKIRDLNADEFVGLVNYNILKSIFKRAKKVEMIFPVELEGKIVREAIYRAIYTGARISHRTNNQVKLQIEATERDISKFAGLARYATKIEIITWSDRKIVISGIKINLGPEQREFDSEIERELYRALKEQGLKVLREPRAIRLGDIVFVPDFGIEIEDRTIFVEVMGYWTKKYIIDKEIKLRRAWEQGIEIIVVAYEKIANSISHIQVKKYTYQTKKDIAKIAKKIADTIKKSSR